MFKSLSQPTSSGAAPVTLHLAYQSGPISVDPQNRNLVLPSDGRPVYVKRASRNGSKLVPSPYNAYFDCQVMSRNHAELSCIKNGPVMIKDTSRHGTFINGDKIAHNQQTELKSGDALRFGDSVMRSSAFPEGKVEGITSTVTFDKKQHMSETHAPPNANVPQGQPRRGWNIRMPLSDDDVTPDDEDDDVNEKLHNSGLSSQDPIDLDEEDTQSDTELAHEATKSSFDMEQSFDLDAETEAELGSTLNQDLDGDGDNSDLDHDFEDDDYDEPRSAQDEDEEENEDDLSEPTSPSQTSSSEIQSLPELGDAPFTQVATTSPEKSDGSNVLFEESVLSAHKAFALDSLLAPLGKQTQDHVPANAHSAVPAAPLPPIRAYAPSAALNMVASFPMLHPTQITGSSARPLGDLLHPEPQKSAPVFYKPVHEQAGLDAQPPSYWIQEDPAYKFDTNPKQLSDMPGHNDLFRNKLSDSHYGVRPQPPVWAHHAIHPQADSGAAGAACSLTSHSEDLNKEPTSQDVQESVSHENLVSAATGGDVANGEDDRTNDEQSQVEPKQRGQNRLCDILWRRDVNAHTESTPGDATKEQANGLKRKRADANMDAPDAEAVYTVQQLEPLVPAAQRSFHHTSIKNVKRLSRPSKRARSSSTSLALTAVAGAVGGAMATLSFLWGPLGERLLESAA